MIKCSNINCKEFDTNFVNNCATPGLQQCSDFKPDIKYNPFETIDHPQHYTAYPVEVIDIIRAALGPEGFKSYCFGNEIKYRLRAGMKGDALEDIKKAMKYKEFRESANGKTD